MTTLNKEQAEKLIACSEDPVYFIENYCLVQHPMHGQAKFSLYPAQKTLISQILNNKYLATTKARQIGFSTVVKALSLWKCLFHGDEHISVMSPSMDQSRYFIRGVQTMYANLPTWMQDMFQV